MESDLDQDRSHLKQTQYNSKWDVFLFSSFSFHRTQILVFNRMINASRPHSMPPRGHDGSHLYFTDFMNNVGKLQAEQNPIFNDVVVTCGKGNNRCQYRMPGIVLAAICPVFKVINHLMLQWISWYQYRKPDVYIHL